MSFIPLRWARTFGKMQNYRYAAEALRRRGARGQATVEMALALVVGIVPLTLGLIAFTEIAWTYHALATLTRQGARYAGTHCWQDDSGSNVVNWMQANAPPFPDRPQMRRRADEDLTFRDRG